MITEPVKISQSDIRRLLSAANPDAALLYLYINGGNRPEGAEADLHFSAPRYGCAAACLIPRSPSTSPPSSGRP